MILDTSACLDLVLDREQGRALQAVLTSPEAPLTAPATLWVEVGRVLRAKCAQGELPLEHAEAALADFLALGVEEADVEHLLIRAWQLRGNLTIDDGVFVALAEALGEPLVTTDLRLARAAVAETGIRVHTHLGSELT